MAIQKIHTTAGQALVGQSLNNAADLTGMNFVFGSGRTPPALDDTGVETPLNPVRSFSAAYAVVSENGNFQSGVNDNTIDDQSGSGGNDYRANELALMKGAVCVFRAVETDPSKNLVTKPSNASYSLNVVVEVDNPAGGTVTVNITHFNGLGDIGIHGRVAFNTPEQFAARESGLFVPMTSQIPAEATADDIAARRGDGYVPASLLPLVSMVGSVERIPPGNLTGSNTIYATPPSDPAALENGMIHAFVAEATSTNLVRYNAVIRGSAVSRELRIDGAQAGAGDIVQGKIYVVMYLNSAWHVIGSNTEYLDHSHFIAPHRVANASGTINWNADAHPILWATAVGNIVVNGFTNGMSGGFYQFIVTASGADRTLALAASYDTGDYGAPAATVRSGRTSVLMFEQVGNERVFLGERTGYTT